MLFVSMFCLQFQLMELPFPPKVIDGDNAKNYEISFIWKNLSHPP